MHRTDKEHNDYCIYSCLLVGLPVGLIKQELVGASGLIKVIGQYLLIPWWADRQDRPNISGTMMEYLPNNLCTYLGFKSGSRVLISLIEILLNTGNYYILF